MSLTYPEIYIQLIANFLIIIFLLGFIILLMSLYQKKRKLKEREIELLKFNFERELLQTRLEIQEDVLKNISMEIHDNIGQVLLLANINVAMLENYEISEEPISIIDETKTMLNKAIEDVSQLSRGLHSDRIIEIGVFNAIIYELELLSKKGIYKIKISNQFPEANTLLSNEKQLIIFRIFQELSKNIIKHAKATEIEFSLQKNGDALEIQLKDNGIGYSIVQEENNRNAVNGIGLRSIEERIKYINGNISVKSKIDSGTSIVLSIPIV